MLKFVILLFAASALLSFGYCVHKENQLRELRAEFQRQKDTSVNSENSLKTEIKELKEKVQQLGSANKANTQLVAAPTTAAPAPQADKLSKTQWSAKLQLRKVEERLALSPDEKSQLEEKLKNGEKLSVLSSVVGEDRAKKFFEDEKVADAAEEDEQIKDKVFKLSRVLGLNENQETEVTNVLKFARQKLRVSYAALRQQEETAMALHSEPGGGDELRAVYEKYRIDLEKINSQENSILTRQLKNVLSEEQLNKLLEYQATKAVGLK